MTHYSLILLYYLAMTEASGSDICDDDLLDLFTTNSKILIK